MPVVREDALGSGADLFDGEDLRGGQAAGEGDDVGLLRELQELADHRGRDALRPLRETLGPEGIRVRERTGARRVPSAIRLPRRSSPDRAR